MLNGHHNIIKKLIYTHINLQLILIMIYNYNNEKKREGDEIQTKSTGKKPKCSVGCEPRPEGCGPARFFGVPEPNAPCTPAFGMPFAIRSVTTSTTSELKSIYKEEQKKRNKLKETLGNIQTLGNIDNININEITNKEVNTIINIANLNQKLKELEDQIVKKDYLEELNRIMNDEKKKKETFHSLISKN